MNEPALLTVKDWAKLEGVGRDLAYRLVREGRVRCVRINRTIKIPRSEVNDFARRESVPQGGGPP